MGSQTDRPLVTVQSQSKLTTPDIEPILAAKGFSRAYHVASVPSIAHIWPEQRCGLYCLHFTDDEFYIGQSLDIARRYLSHRQTWDDIATISFKPVNRAKLNEEEEALIKLLERERFRLRNIVHTTPGRLPFGMADFDTLMSAESQERWLSDLSYIDKSGTRIVNKAQRAKYTRKFQRFLTQPYAEEIIHILREYVQLGIPAYIAGEMNFWVCTCLLKKASSDLLVLSRININMQTVLEVYLFRQRPLFSFYVAKSVIKQGSRFKELLLKLRLWRRGVWFTPAQYKPGGQDQVHFEVADIEGARAVLANPIIQQAIREFNLRLARKGPTISSKFHCFDLSDRLLEE